MTDLEALVVAAYVFADEYRVPAGQGRPALTSDAELVALASYPGCQQRSEFAGFARYGYSKSHHRFVWGVRLVLLTDERGLPLGYTIVPANEKEYEPLADLLTGTPAEVVIADKGLWGRAYRERLAAGGTLLPTPDKTR